MKILAIAWKDLRSTARNVPALVMMLVAPLALAALLGFAFGGGGGFEIAATKVVVANLDGGGAEAGQNAGAAIQTVLTSKDLRGRARDEHPELRRRRPAGRRRRRGGGRGHRARGLQRRRVRQRPGGEVPGRGLREPDQRDRRLHRRGRGRAGARRHQRRPGGGRRRRRARRARATTPSTRRCSPRRAAEQFSHDGGVSAGLQIGQRAPKVGATEEEVSVTGLILAGMMVFFMFFGAANVARTILTEDRDGTLPRLFTTPTRHGTIIGGKFVSTFLTVLAQAVVLLVAGRLIFGIQWGPLDAVVLLTVVTAGVAGGLALLVIAFTKNAGAGGRDRRRRLPRPRAARRQLHRHRADRHHLRVHPAVHPQRLAPARVGHGHARRRRCRHPLAAARAARVRRRLLLLRRAADAEAVRVRRSP